MKNLKWQINSTDRLNFILSQVSADVAAVPAVANLLQAAASIPIVWFDYSDPDLERLHFSVWWGCIGLRTGTYTNARVRDLYLLHELAHLVYHASMDPPTDGTDFFRQRIAEERYASFFSEVDIYNHMPQLRGQTFQFPILWDEVRELDSGQQALARIAAETGEPATPAQALVKKYAADNQAWCQIWSDKYAHVERLWRQLIASGDYAAHICALSAVSTGNIPWADKAAAFSAHLNKNATEPTLAIGRWRDQAH